MFWWFRSSFQILQNDQYRKHKVAVLSPTETLLSTYLGPIKDKPIHCIDLNQKGRNPWGTIPDPTDGIGPWIWVHFSCISSRAPSFSSPPFRQQPAFHTSFLISCDKGGRDDPRGCWPVSWYVWTSKACWHSCTALGQGWGRPVWNAWKQQTINHPSFGGTVI